MDKQTKREFKKRNKFIFVFLCIAFPVLLVLVSLLYMLVPSLVNNQWVVIMLVVVVGGLLYALMISLSHKREEKKEKAPKKHDPFAD